MLSACGDRPEPREQFSVPMRFTANTVGSDSQYSVNITPDFCDIEFQSNGILGGATLHFEGKKSFAAVGEFTIPVEENSFPAMKALINAVRSLASTDVIGEEEQNGVKYTIDETMILVYYDKDTNKVIGIRTEELGRVFEFTLSDLEAYEAQSNGAGRP